MILQHKHLVYLLEARYLELGLPTPNPYLEPGEPAVSFNHGVNFAVAGSTALNTSVLLQNGILSPVTNSSLLVQLDWFLAYYQNLCETAKNCETYNILKGSLFMVGETGGNDYNYAFLQGKSIEDATALVPLVVNNIRDVAKLAEWVLTNAPQLGFETKSILKVCSGTEVTTTLV
ncbi:hypothetical protein IFM89_021000 [Coptis chinensis]|uniref:Uncharacterized protein n=1 Tax=Coptis chinensis TaxID=261450 RepID=A0A835LIT7_9MAGN|nr:hypothetical protein IFM89_021000 [Coptis chinensis]